MGEDWRLQGEPFLFSLLFSFPNFSLRSFLEFCLNPLFFSFSTPDSVSKDTFHSDITERRTRNSTNSGMYLQLGQDIGGGRAR